MNVFHTGEGEIDPWRPQWLGKAGEAFKLREPGDVAIPLDVV